MCNTTGEYSYNFQFHTTNEARYILSCIKPFSPLPLTQGHMVMFRKWA